MQRLGQHFLRDKKILQRIVSKVDWKDFGAAIEIGPGEGVLTLLVQKELSPKSKMFIIEKDRRLAARLINQFKDELMVEVCEGDALISLPEIVSQLPKKAYIIFGNIPYYITGKLLRNLRDLEPQPKEILIMVQKEVGERMCAMPPRMNRLAASVQLWAKPQIVANISKKYFTPSPEVDSVVVKISPRPQSLLPKKEMDILLKTLFQQPRKTVVNNLIALKFLRRAVIEEVMESLKIDLKKRPQDLSLEEMIGLASCLE